MRFSLVDLQRFGGLVLRVGALSVVDLEISREVGLVSNRFSLVTCSMDAPMQ